jgi:hypothetical protein
MTVAELIAELEKQPQDMDVCFEAEDEFIFLDGVTTTTVDAEPVVEVF